jgi:hypothetical protein
MRCALVTFLYSLFLTIYADVLVCFREVSLQFAEDALSDSYSRFRRYPQVTTLAENQAFCEFLESILDEQ